MSWAQSAWDIGKEVVTLGCEAGHVAGKATPLIGTALNGIDALRYYGKSSDEDRKGNQDEADYYHDKAGYSVLKAIPGIGTALGVTELCAGVGSAYNGGGFHDGMETVADYTMDIGAMAGIGLFGASNPIPGTGAPPHRWDRDDDGWDGDNRHDQLGSHKKLRKSIEAREALEERVEHAKKSGHH